MQQDNSYQILNNYNSIDDYNYLQGDVDIHLIGDKNIIGQTITLLCYIRNALQNNLTGKIEVDINNTIANPSFMMDVNGLQIPDLSKQDVVEIN